MASRKTKKNTLASKRVTREFAELNEGVYGNKDASDLPRYEQSQYSKVDIRGTGGEIRREKLKKRDKQHKDKHAGKLQQPKVPPAIWKRLEGLQRTSRQPGPGEYRPLNGAFQTHKGFYPCPGMHQLPLPLYGSNARSRRRDRRRHEREFDASLTQTEEEIFQDKPIEKWAGFVPNRVVEDLAEALENLKLAQAYADTQFK